DDVLEEPARQDLARRAVQITGKATIEVAVVQAGRVDRACVEGRRVGNGHDDDAARYLMRLDAGPQAPRRLDAHVLGSMDARGDRHTRTIALTVDGDHRHRYRASGYGHRHLLHHALPLINRNTCDG